MASAGGSFINQTTTFTQGKTRTDPMHCVHLKTPLTRRQKKAARGVRPSGRSMVKRGSLKRARSALFPVYPGREESTTRLGKACRSTGDPQTRGEQAGNLQKHSADAECPINAIPAPIHQPSIPNHNRFRWCQTVAFPTPSSVYTTAMMRINHGSTSLPGIRLVAG